MSDTEQRKQAISLEVVDIHLDYLRGDMQKVLAAIDKMATREDLRALETRMQAFVTRQEFDALAGQVKAESVRSTFDSWLSIITRIGSAVAVLVAAGGGIYVLVHWLDRVPK
jgi:glucokinase